MHTELLDMVANVGFPIAVSVYLLIRIEGRLQKLSDSIDGLSGIIEKSLT